MAQVFIATEAFAVETSRREDDTPVMRIVHVGDKLPANDPLLKGREQLFRPLDSTDK